MTYPAGGPPPPAKEGASTIAGLQLPSSPPRGQWNSTDEWYQNSLMALRDRDDSDDDSDRESDKRASEKRERAERERKEKEQREAEEKEKKLKEGKEREEREKQEKETKEKKEKEEQERREKHEKEAKEEKERLERVRAKEEKDRREKEREEREKREREEEGKTEADSPLAEEKPTRSSEDIREIEQFTPIEKREENSDVDEENRRRELEDKERKEREESARKEKEKKEQEKEREKLAEQERKEREEKERHERERTGMVPKHEVFTDPLSSSLNSPIVDEIFGSGSSSGEDSPPPRRQATFDGNMPTPVLPDAPHRRRSGSLNFDATTGSPAKPPALPPRVHETAPTSSQPKPAQQPASKYRTTSHMFEDFDFSFPSTTPPATGSPLASTSAPHAPVPTPSTSSFLGLTTPAVPMTSSPPSPRRSLPPSSASNTDNLFSFSASTSSAASSSSAPSTKPGAKKGLFNLDMDDLFNKVRVASRPSPPHA